MSHVILMVSYDPAVVVPEHLAGLLLEVEGVENVKVKDGD
jgi:hypothetical protein